MLLAGVGHMPSKQVIIDYLNFLEQHALNLLSKENPGDEDLRSLNLEINQLLRTLESSRGVDDRLLGDAADLKVQFDETKARRGWGRTLLDESMRLLPGGWLVRSEVEEIAAKKRLEELSEFKARLDAMRESIHRYRYSDEA